MASCKHKNLTNSCALTVTCRRLQEMSSPNRFRQQGALRHSQAWGKEKKAGVLSMMAAETRETLAAGYLYIPSGARVNVLCVSECE